MSQKRCTDREIIAALLQHPTKQEAAAALGIAPQTISTKLRDSEFLRLYDQAQDEVLREVTATLSSAAVEAVNVLLDVMRKEGISDGMRVQTAKDLLQLHKTYVRTEQLTHRIEALEELTKYQ